MIRLVRRAPRWRKVAALFAAVLLAASCHPPIAAARPQVIGMCVRMMFSDPAEVEQQFDLMAKMKVNLVRVDFDWSAIEGVRGQYDWSYSDRMVAQAAAHDMQVLALLTYTPEWARPPGTTSHAAPLRDADFAEFSRAAASRYAAKGVRQWEIWNEPNSSDYWQPLPDVDRYGGLFRAAAGAIRQVDGGATVITGGLTRGTDAADGRRISQSSFLAGLYRNGSAQTANAVAVHPYSFPSQPEGFGPVGGFGDMPTLHALMQRWGDGDKSIWITEFGAPTGTAPEAMSEGEQATSLLQARQLAQSWEWTGPLVFYELRDAGDDAADLEQNFGVARPDLSLKDAGKALLK